MNLVCHELKLCFVLYSFLISQVFSEDGKKIKSDDHFRTASTTSRPFSRTSHTTTEEPITESSVLSAESCKDDMACLTMASQDRLGLEAIRSLHRQLDDDADGAVDLMESDEFLREELKYENGAERRQKAFHRNDDMHISVKELWDAWVKSEVHNWTVEQTSEWLASNVELPQYVPIFILHRVTGAHLPRLAVNNMQYLSNVLGIKDPIHKQKIALKAMDVVLFGPPKDYGHHVKDLVLVSLLLLALSGCWYAYHTNKVSRRHLKRMMKDMEGLHKAELALDNLQKELERAKQEQEFVTTEKQNLEKRLKEQTSDNSDLKTSFSDLEVSQLKAEIEALRNELQRAEGELEDRCWAPPPGLQHWLQLTHELENKSYVKKKISAEKQLQQAREACEKLRKKRSSLVGAFVSTHGKSIDDVDRSIVEARTSLNEVTQELAERVHRWKQIELLCGFNIINNSGLAYLENMLYRNVANGRGFSLRSRMSSSQDDLDDDSMSYSMSQDFGDFESSSVREDQNSSESERFDPEDEDEKSRHSQVQFIVGGDSPVNETSPAQKLVPQQSDEATAASEKQGALSHSDREASVPYLNKNQKSIRVSQNVDAMALETECRPGRKHSQTSQTSQGSTENIEILPRGRRLHKRNELHQSHSTSGVSSADEEVLAGELLASATEDVSDLKRQKKSLLHFPKFSRKVKQSSSPQLSVSSSSKLPT
nr:PREDICTED: stromal interaction molecule homolog isoform X2 [Bemisia tabaci]